MNLVNVMIFIYSQIIINIDLKGIHVHLEYENLLHRSVLEISKKYVKF